MLTSTPYIVILLFFPTLILTLTGLCTASMAICGHSTCHLTDLRSKHFRPQHQFVCSFMAKWPNQITCDPSQKHIHKRRRGRKRKKQKTVELS